jgi:hypothetical protein
MLRGIRDKWQILENHFREILPAIAQNVAEFSGPPQPGKSSSCWCLIASMRITLLGQKAIERDIAGLSVGNNQLAYLTFDAPTDQRVMRKNLDGFTNSNSRIRCGRRIVLCQKRECPLQIGECVCV